MSDEPSSRQLTPREPDEASDGRNALTSAPEGEQRSVERFSAGPKAHMVGLTEERGAQIVRQSANARTWVFLAILLIVAFIPIYWFVESGVPALGIQGRMEQAAKRLVGDDPPQVAPVDAPGTPDDPRVISLKLTGSLEIVDAEGKKVEAIAVVAAETVRFQVDNTADFPHNLFIGPADDLAADRTSDLPGLPPWSTGVRSFDWVVPMDGRLQFACTIPGHYGPMHGAVVVQS
jgi:hypothetical protein